MKKVKPTYRLLGVDPGTNVMGYAVIEITGKKIKVLDMGIITMNKLKTQQEKLKKIFERIQVIIELYQPKEMAIEAPFFGKNVQAMLKLGRAQGVAIAAAMTKNVAVTEYAPRKIKQSITGNGNAAKEQVSALLGQILNISLKDQTLDATDALGAAVCHYYQSTSLLGGKKRYSDWGSFLKDNPQRKG